MPRPKTPAAAEGSLCVQCRFCKWDRIDADGPPWPYCANPVTKEFDPPIFFLHAHSVKCSEFQARVDEEKPVAIKSLHDRLVSAARQREGSAVTSWKAVWGQVCELIAMAVAGAGASNLDKPAGVAAFGLGLSIAVILLVNRIGKG